MCKREQARKYHAKITGIEPATVEVDAEPPHSNSSRWESGDN